MENMIYGLDRILCAVQYLKNQGSITSKDLIFTLNQKKVFLEFPNLFSWQLLTANENFWDSIKILNGAENGLSGFHNGPVTLYFLIVF